MQHASAAVVKLANGYIHATYYTYYLASFSLGPGYSSNMATRLFKLCEPLTNVLPKYAHYRDEIWKFTSRGLIGGMSCDLY